MSIQRDKGKWQGLRLNTIKIKTIREKHPLNFQSYSIAAHHLISCEVAKNLSIIRKDQIEKKGYNINHVYNLVFLPTIDKLSCQYEIPLHKSGHTDKLLESSFGEDNETSIDEIVSELSVNLLTENADKSNLLKADISLINSVSGYHRVVASMLAKTLKELDCDTDDQVYVDTIDELSLDISDLLGKFKLYLISRGRHMSPGGDGCHFCRKELITMGKRNHYEIGSQGLKKKVPSQADVSFFCFADTALKTIGEQEEE